ncbi:hypothetical protein ElyMa_001442300 [Elysia marginata]|uniref:Uncharacterized protein n=1 Tax=Elysia marginata TaxID=1093978 RepID=A0AAV4J3B2_9GAST|nr:hypothetical protein ElyMa_001442300 [Elysia marginata]
MNFYRCWTGLRVDLVIGASTHSVSGDATTSGSNRGTTGSSSDSSRTGSTAPNTSNNRHSGVSGATFDLDPGVERIPPNSFPLSPDNIRQNSVSQSPPGKSTGSDVISSTNNDPSLRANAFGPVQENNAPSTLTNKVPVLPTITNAPLQLTNTVPNQLTENHIGLPVDPSVAFVPLLLNGNSMDLGSSGFVLIPLAPQNQVGSDTDSLGVSNALNQLGSVFSGDTNTRGNSRDLGSRARVNSLRPNPIDLNQFDLFQSTQTNPNQGLVENSGRNRARTRPSRDRISVINNGFPRQSIPRNSRARAPANQNLLDRNLIRGDELFTNPHESTFPRGDLEFPTRFFMTPGALLRFLERNSL